MGKCYNDLMRTAPASLLVISSVFLMAACGDESITRARVPKSADAPAAMGGMPQDEQGWLTLWAANPEQAREMTLHMATALEDALPQIAGALLGAWHVRREAEGCQMAASLALQMAGPRFPRNAKSAAPTEGAALEMPGLTGGQMVTLPQLSEGSGQSTSTG